MKCLQVFLIAVLMFAFSSSYAGSKVYQCKDANGKTVFQQTPCADNAITGDTIAHNLWRKMKKLASEGALMLNALGASLESIKQCNSDIKPFRAKVLSLQAKVNSVKISNPNLFKAHEALLLCAQECRTSNASSCYEADQYLKKAMPRLMEI